MASLGKLRQGGLLAAVLGLVLCGLGFVTGRADFFEGYLTAYGFWISISCGCLGLLLIHSMTGGRWGKELRPMLLAGVRTFPILLLLLIPIVLGMKDLYSWTRPDFVAAHALMQAKSSWLNQPFFLGRLAGYFIVFLGLSILISRKNPSQGVGGVGCLLFVLAVSFLAFDLFMSLEPLWFSSIYGGLFMVGSLVATFSALAIFTGILREGAPADHWHDIGKFMLMSVMLWAYLNFSQYLIIYAAHIPEEMEWYDHRRFGGWQYLGLTLVVAHFAVPFVLLLSRKLKRAGTPLIYLGTFLLFMRFLDFWWWVSPAFHPNDLHFPLWAPAGFLAIGGLWLFQFARSLERTRAGA